MIGNMKVSVVVPTYNEEEDIAGTLNALLAVGRANLEIIVVDDSNDRTPEIVKEYEGRGVKLIHPGGGGRCEARNIGIRQASGEIVCILNADVRLPPSFFDSVERHYAAGADYVLVTARVSNLEDLFARYVQAVSEMNYADADWIEWTEGFTCRKEVAIASGLFPTGYAVPIVAGEDGYFGAGLRRIGAKKVIDRSIVIEHVAPATLRSYWRARKEKGYGSPQVHRFLYKWTMPRIIGWNLLKSVRLMAYVALLLPGLFHCLRATRFSRRGLLDLGPFWIAWLIEQWAVYWGVWQSILRIAKAEAAVR